MRRPIASLVILLLCVGLLAPFAIATVTAGHSCCIKTASGMQGMHHHHCAGSTPTQPGFSDVSSGCHGGCCLALTFSTQSPARPRAFAISGAVETQHTFLNEFYPSESSNDE